MGFHDGRRRAFAVRTPTESVSESVTVLLSTLLFRTIIVAAVLLVLKYIYEGVFMMAGMLLLALSFLAYLSFTEARLLD